MGALHVNGQKATGVNITLADGVFIDTDNVIVAKTSYTPSTFSYTATEDCVLYIEIPAQGGYSTFLEIDGKKVQGVNLAGSGTTNYLIATVLLKKGQTATLSSSNLPSVTPDYAVYGIQQGTIEGKLQPVIYSLEEREVGVWTDGKPLYQKTIIKDSNFVSGANQIAHNISNVGEIISNESTLYYNNGDCVHLPAITLNSSGWTAKTRDFGDTYFYLDLGGDMLAYVASASFTLFYTKTTDTPGAGTWTPDGAYAHHYSTDEKVVGTWIDGKTLYEKTYDLGQDVIIKFNEWTEVNATKPNGISKYINIFGTQDDGTGVVLTGANPANTTFSNIRLSTRRFQDESVRWFTIQYTKSLS